MAYQYPIGGASPIIPPHSITPIPQRAVTPSIPTVAPGGQIAPGSLTYTTAVGQDGQIIYHLFKAMAASYQTPQGIVSGIQWIPADATSVIPAGATPATADILASFNRPGDERYKDWQRDEDRRRRDIEKELRRDSRRHDREDELEEDIRRARDRDDRERLRRDDRRKSSGYAYERDLDRSFRDMDLKERDDREWEREKRERRERERDREYEREKVRSRRGSMYGEQPAGYPVAPATAGYPTAGAAGYAPSSPYATSAAQPYPTAGQPYPAAGQPYPTAGQPYAAAGYGTQPVSPRPVSPYQAGGVLPRAASPYAQPGALPRSASPYAQPSALPRSASPYAPPPGGASYAPPPRAASPYAPPPRAASPYAPPPRAASPYQQASVVPPRSPYQGAGAIPGGYPPRAVSPSPYGAAPGPYGAQPGYPAAPGYGGAPGAGYQAQQAYPPPPTAEAAPMPAPDGFSRPPNLAQSYTRFEPLKIQDMDDFYENIPRMPLVLVPHDVHHEDWIRLMTDLSLAWSGKLPVPDRDGRPPKRTALTSDLVELWNTSFFLRRGVEVVLYKGRERRSGRNIGAVDVHLPGFDDLAGLSDDDDSELDSSEDDDDLEERSRYGAYGGAYGRGVEVQMAELREAKRIRRERKRAEKKRRRQEKKQRRKLKEAERKYALYITCVNPEL
ncbi:hypothetical protein BDW22DRAFT_531556 [Trametopsis cervina]|nr:hypothetical protein BDW22DRAFT_531556 [Trametopsis cervina]